MAKQVDVQLKLLSARRERQHRVMLGRQGHPAVEQPQAPRHARDVGVHRHVAQPVGEQQHAGGSLAPHPRQIAQVAATVGHRCALDPGQERLAARAGGADAPRLIAQQALGAAAQKQLDRPGAIETRRVQSAQVAAAERAAGDQAAAGALEKQAEQKRQGGGLRGRAERRGLLQKAEQLHSQAQVAHCDVEQLAIAEQQLLREGRHLNGWVEQHGEPAAAGLAAERELAERRLPQAAAAGRPAAVIADPELAEIQRLQRAAWPTSAPARPRRTYQDRGRNDRGQGGIER